MTQRKYGTGELPYPIGRWIFRQALKRAGWKLIEGEYMGGSTMLLEWTSFTYTPAEWIKEIEGWQIKIPQKYKRILMDMENNVQHI